MSHENYIIIPAYVNKQIVIFGAFLPVKLCSFYSKNSLEVCWQKQMTLTGHSDLQF